MKEDSFFVHGVTMQLWVIKEDSLFVQGFPMKTMGNEGRLIVHTRGYNANNG
ncbi:hypothetical protein KSS87_019128 [Heliosperma pusillum]|nr:hypothetical protein KSS87_019128 [Heliosperma pusillum]